MPLRIYAAPAADPLTVAEIKTRLRIDTTAYDTEIAAYISTVTGQMDGGKGWLGHCMVEQTWDLVLPRFPAACDPGAPDILIPLSPLVSVTHVKYLDADLVERTFSSASYIVTTAGDPPRIVLASGASWPSIGVHPEPVTVRFVAGYPNEGSPPVGTIPEPLLQALTLGVKILLDDPAPDEAARLQGLIDGLTVNYRRWAF